MSMRLTGGTVFNRGEIVGIIVDELHMESERELLKARLELLHNIEATFLIIDEAPRLDVNKIFDRLMMPMPVLAKCDIKGPPRNKRGKHVNRWDRWA